LTVEDGNIVKETELQADQMRNTIDVLVRDVLAASASSTTCSNGDPTVTLLNKTDIDAVRLTLRTADAAYLTSMITAGGNQGTSPIAEAYWGIADADLENDLELVSGFKEVKNYASQGNVAQGEYGCTGRVRWLTTTQGYVSGSTYSCPIIAKGAYGIIDINGGNAKSMVFRGGGINDPLAQTAATVGWKMWQVARILNDSFIHVLKCTNA
jgi:N4-gp56 family major capsid protein